LSSRFTTIEGLYNLKIDVSGTPAVDMLKKSITIRLNQPPQIKSTLIPDSIPSGARDSLFKVTVVDADGVEDVSSVQLIQKRPSGGEESYSMFKQNDSLWVYRNRPEIAKWIPTGWVTFQFKVTDLYQNQTISPVDSVFLTNLPPEISAVDGVDTIRLGPTDSLYFYYFISVRDDQGVQDLDTLKLHFKSPDRPTFLFTYLDNGDTTKFDSTANDGRYTAWFKADSTSRRDVLFTFDWIPTDRTGQQGETVTRTLIILDAEPGSGGGRQSPLRRPRVANDIFTLH